MSQNFGTDINLNQNELRNPVSQNLGTAPSSPKPGQFYYDTALGVWRYRSATAWIDPLARANHTGTQVAATISDLTSVVQAYRLDQFAAPNTSVSFNGQKITNLGTPTVGTDAVTKSYADALLQGQDPKPSANWATTAALPANTYSNGTAGVGATLTATANGVLSIDGGTPALGDRILVLNEATSANKGLYTLTTLGTASVPYVLTRDVTMDQTNEFGGALIAVESGGTANGNTLWLCTAAETITVGTTALSFTKLNSSTAINGSTSILNSANTLSVITKPGGGLSTDAGGVYVDGTVAARKFAQTIGDGTTTSFALTHGLATLDVQIQVVEVATGATYYTDAVRNSTTQATISFNTAPSTNQFRVLIQG